MRHVVRRAVMPALVMLVAAATPAAAATASLTTLYTFTGATDGAYPASAPVLGYNGNLYGTTLLGGAGCSGTGCGTIYQLAPPAAGSSTWTLTTLFRFGGGSDGEEPVNIIAGSNGVLYGVAEYGANKSCLVNGVALGCGTIFTLIPPITGSTWTFYSLYEFTGAGDGAFPAYGLTRDANGNLYGTALGGGNCATHNCGTIWKLSPPTGNQTTWQLTTLHSFGGGADGYAPYSTPMLDSAGNVYASASAGGSTASAMCLATGGCGLVLKFAPPVPPSNTWKKTLLWSFTGKDGLLPQGGLLQDAGGNILGVTNMGDDTAACPGGAGIQPGCGTVFELTPPAAGTTKWTRTTAWKFTAGADGLYPDAGLVAGTNNAYYTTTSGNGTQGFGTVVKLTPPAAGATKWTEKNLFTFSNDADGAQPAAALLLHNSLLYGTTLGHDGPAPARYGTIFSITP
jgi:hypothetical protein